MQRTLESALKGLREAVTRWAANIRSHYIARKYTKLVGVEPKKEREKYRSLVKVTESGTYTLTAPFSTAITQAEAETRAAQQRAQQSREQRQQQQRARRPRQQSQQKPSPQQCPTNTTWTQQKMARAPRRRALREPLRWDWPEETPIPAARAGPGLLLQHQKVQGSKVPQ